MRERERSADFRRFVEFEEMGALWVLGLWGFSELGVWSLGFSI